MCEIYLTITQKVYPVFRGKKMFLTCINASQYYTLETCNSYRLEAKSLKRQLLSPRLAFIKISPGQKQKAALCSFI